MLFGSPDMHNIIALAVIRVLILFIYGVLFFKGTNWAKLMQQNGYVAVAVFLLENWTEDDVCFGFNVDRN